MPSRRCLVGLRHNRLTVIAEGDGEGRRRLLVRCDCGTEKWMARSGVYHRKMISCGCHFRALLRARNTKHGRSRSPENVAWLGIKQRCLNQKNRNYPDYGGRGITVCARWRDSFPAFLADMGPRPSPKHSIDRIDNDGNYEPGNCRWASVLEQGVNKRRNRRLTFRGETKALEEWARELGVHAPTIRARIDKRGWTVEAALSTPVAPRSGGIVARSKKGAA